MWGQKTGTPVAKAIEIVFDLGCRFYPQVVGFEQVDSPRGMYVEQCDHRYWRRDVKLDVIS